MIIKTTDFTLDAYIPNRDDAPNSAILGNETELQGFIDEYEEDVLVKLLGYDLYSELQPELLKLPFTIGAIETADAKWIDLVNGVDNYRGMKKLIVGYVFWKFLQSDESHYSTVGVEKENSDNAEAFPVRPKAIQQYRKFYEYAIGSYYSVGSYNKPSIWGNLKVVLWSGAYGSDSNFKSLYQYLNENLDLYNNWAPSNFKNQNQFDV